MSHIARASDSRSGMMSPGLRPADCRGATREIRPLPLARPRVDVPVDRAFGPLQQRVHRELKDWHRHSIRVPPLPRRIRRWHFAALGISRREHLALVVVTSWLSRWSHTCDRVTPTNSMMKRYSPRYSTGRYWSRRNGKG